MPERFEAPRLASGGRAIVEKRQLGLQKLFPLVGGLGLRLVIRVRDRAVGCRGGRLVEIRVVAANRSQTSVALHAPHPPSVQKACRSLFGIRRCVISSLGWVQLVEGRGLIVPHWNRAAGAGLLVGDKTGRRRGRSMRKKRPSITISLVQARCSRRR